MSINRDMKTYMLQKKKTGRTESGANHEEWIDVDVILVSIKKVNGMRVSGNVRYAEASHTGLTHYRNIRSGTYRLLDKDGTVYEIMDANTDERLTNLVLKVVEEDA